jgi:hypothetical protein
MAVHNVKSDFEENTDASEDDYDFESGLDRTGLGGM